MTPFHRFLWRRHAFMLFCVVYGALAPAASAVPLILQYQGFIRSDSSPVDGEGFFKFALIDEETEKTVWSHDMSSVDGAEPTSALTLLVDAGYYSVRLGDPAFPMSPMEAAHFASDALALRVWFSDGVSGFERLEPDQKIATVAFSARAGVADTVVDGGISENALDAAFTEKLASMAQQLEALNQNRVVSSPSAEDTILVDAGFTRFQSLPAPAWTQGATENAPIAAGGFAEVWMDERSEWMIWGGSSGGGAFSSEGARYHSTADEWTTVTPVDAPEARSGAAMVWTGAQGILWGGFSNEGFLNSGSLYDPNEERWEAISATDAPVGRVEFAAVWTGATLAVFGGRNGSGLLGDGAVYDPESDAWTPIPSDGAPSARSVPASAWIDGSWFLWGGQGPDGLLGDGAVLEFDAAGQPTGWTTVSGTDAPTARKNPGVAATDNGVFLWGGSGAALLADGAFWEAESKAWTALPDAADAELTARSDLAAVWTGTEFILWGGETAAGPVNSGAAWNPGERTWRALENPAPPGARSQPAAAWTGTEFALFGGAVGSVASNHLFRVDPQPALHLYHKP